MGQVMRGSGVGSQTGGPGCTSSRVFRTETGIAQGTLPRWAAELGMEPAFQATWPVSECQSPQTKRKLLVWAGGTHMSGAGLGAWHPRTYGSEVSLGKAGTGGGGLVGMGSTVAWQAGPRGKGTGRDTK